MVMDMDETLEILLDTELMESIKRAKKQQPKRSFEEFLKEVLRRCS